MSVQAVTLEFFKEEYRDQLRAYRLTREQSRYASLPLQTLARCKPSRAMYPVVILYYGVPAGFFVLQGWEGAKMYSSNEQAVLLRDYSISATFQGKGIAKKSLLLLDAFLQNEFPDKNAIVLSVHHHNKIARHVYQKSGFIDKGIRTLGMRGELCILHKNLF